jgi:hypothetical protein
LWLDWHLDVGDQRHLARAWSSVVLVQFAERS